MTILCPAPIKSYPTQIPEPLKSPDRLAAIQIASLTLRSNMISVDDSKYLLAGKNQYHTLWARDLSMSIAGTLLLGETQAARDSLEVFFKFQREDGLLPRIVDNQNIVSRVLLGLMGFPPAFKNPLKGSFTTENRVISIDGNLMLPWAGSCYIAQTGDEVFADRWFRTMERAIAFIEKNYLVEGLVGNQPPFSDWEDSIRRTGRVSFTNVFYILALRGATQWARLLKLSSKVDYFSTRTEQVTRAFINYFWLPERKILRNFEGNETLAADANLLAVAYHLIPKDQALEVMHELRLSPLWNPVAGCPTWPDYPNSLKSRLIKLIGLHGYHDRLYWIWISALAARAERAIGNSAKSEEILNFLAQRIVKDQGIYEVYEAFQKDRTLKTIRPYRGPIYRADRSFTWSSAYYLEAELSP